MTGNGRKNGDALALALASGASIVDAATTAGMSERTAYRRLAKPAFRRRVAEVRAEMVARALGKRADGMSDAASTLRKLLKAKSESVRLSACRALLELGVKLRESVELEARLSELEAKEIAREPKNAN
jgi:hypothetical protein